MSIVLENVSHTYMKGTPYERTALKNISLEIHQGEFVAVIGHTGSGKSTLVQHLNGLLKPSAGRVTIDGTDISAKTPEAKAARRKVGMVFQYPEQQLFEETVFDDIAFGPRNLGVTDDEAEMRVRRAMEFVGLKFEDFAKRSPFHLSGGQMRRVAIAGVIALQPEYLILDEPSAGLDPRGREEIFGQILNLYKATGVTVILVSHNMEDVAKMANRLVVMREGTVAVDGMPEKVFSQDIAVLRESGLDVPHVTSLLGKLRERGLDVDDSLITIDAAVKNITDALRRRGKC